MKMLEVGKTDGSFGQNGPRKAGSRKRKQGLQHVFTGENVASLTLPEARPMSPVYSSRQCERSP